MAPVNAVLVGVLQWDSEFPGGVEEDAHPAHRVVEDGEAHLADVFRLWDARETFCTIGLWVKIKPKAESDCQLKLSK